MEPRTPLEIISQCRNGITPSQNELDQIFIENAINHCMTLKNIQEEAMSRLPPGVAEKLRELQEKHREHQKILGIDYGKNIPQILKSKYDTQQQLKLGKYLTRVNQQAAEKMMYDEGFASLFLNQDEFQSVVLSVDIRRSTSLMLGAESPRFYAQFMNILTCSFEDSIKANYGIYDKFTGDGMLAFFPDFYSGDNAILHAIKCASECNEIFESLYGRFRENFHLEEGVNTGLGAGLDYGSVYKAGAELEYTVVGSPVVYACRLSSAPAGKIYMTSKANARLKENECPYLTTESTLINIKHQGSADVYNTIFTDPEAFKKFEVQKPSWCGAEE